MDDGIAFVRGLTKNFDESTLRLAAAARRWEESLETGRLHWDDSAGREVFQRFLDPHHALLASAGAKLRVALETQLIALARATEASAEAAQAAVAIGQAAAAIPRAREHADRARTQAAEARSNATRARNMSQYVIAGVAELGT